MSKYRTEVITLPKSLPRVRVIIDYSDTDFSDTFTDIPVDTGYQVIPQMAKWCEENECGYRTSYDTFKFRNQEQLTMFLLRWS